MDIVPLIALCAPLVAPDLMAGIVDVASKGQPWAIYRLDTRESLHPENEPAAVALAKRLLAEKVTFEAGLAQLSSKEFATLALTPENVFSACAHLGAAEEKLLREYMQDPGDLDAALSRFRFGDPATGVKAGYAASVREAAKGFRSGGSGQETSPGAAAETARPGRFEGVPDGFASGR